MLASAARLQGLVPDAVLVGGSDAALYAHHRESFDHDHVLVDLVERCADVVEAVEASDGWVTRVRASSPPVTLLGSLDGIEAGLRQLRRTSPSRWRRPTIAEMLRIKAYLVVQRTVVRDYLDTVALADRVGIGPAAEVLTGIDHFYADRSNEADSVLTTLVTRLSEPAPRDVSVIRQLGRYRYKGLDPQWQEWSAVVSVCHELADAIISRLEEVS